jgi:hypothetical protein
MEDGIATNRDVNEALQRLEIVSQSRRKTLVVEEYLSACSAHNIWRLTGLVLGGR